MVAHIAHIDRMIEMDTGMAALPLDTYLGVLYIPVGMVLDMVADTELGMVAGMAVDTALGMAADTVAADILPCPLMLRQIAMLSLLL